LRAGARSRAEGGPALSTYQQPGRGYRPLALAGDPALDALSEQRAPITLRQYVRPLGNGWHLIKRDCNDAPYEASSSRGATFREGETVAVVGEGGLRGEIIIGPAATATADYPTVALGLNLSLDIPPPPPTEPEPPPVVCPVSLTGRTYIGFLDNFATSTVYAFLYADGAYQSTIASKSYAAVFAGIRAGRVLRSHSSSGDVLVFGVQQLSTFNVAYVTWDLAANTFAMATTTLDTTGHGGPVLDGLDLYFTKFRTSPRGISLYKIAVGASGAVNLTTALQGAALLNGSLTVHSSSMSHAGGANFDVPGATLSGVEVVPYFTGGAWNVGSGRSLLAGLASSGNRGGDNTGYAVGSSRSLRLTYHFGASSLRVAALLPAGPGTPEAALFPADLQALADLRSNTLSVSPSGTEFSAGTGATSNRWVRFKVDDLGYTLVACPLAYFSTGSAPGGAVPSMLLCRDF
jgi:hypothetical protein